MVQPLGVRNRGELLTPRDFPKEGSLTGPWLWGEGRNQLLGAARILEGETPQLHLSSAVESLAGAIH